MISAKKPHDDAERLAALRKFDVLDTEAEQCFDDITEIAAELCDTPIAMVSLVDYDRQWFKSCHGSSMTQTPRDVAFCAYAILEPEVFVVPDAEQDERFVDNPLVTGAPHIRFYAGAPLTTAEGHEIGTLCVIDHQRRTLSDRQLSALAALSRQVVAQLELRLAKHELDAARDKSD